ncbi:MAG: response regulator [Deltaproteobacteria bacterium]|jgi:CheY-like chemotaxis protein|nr:response regulator [Deltaproteobacteria bacterium]MBT4089760.1 response regulator [Deltaproteobacteria bacterium]MBT4263430.1 response regulator [Deltaproteobacteria bacterium]MBT4638411.1 response regulator [Deltaproteobacteria bacterium]MBT6502129.1 response regulator [Deltaproteobacteria bacterium]
MDQKSILIVEDEAITAMEIESCLKDLGCEVSGIVNSGEKALKRISKNGINLILMDIQLKGELNGIEAAEIIHSKYNVPVIFLTAFAEKEKAIRSRFSFPFGFLTKPFNEYELRSAIDKVED